MTLNSLCLKCHTGRINWRSIYWNEWLESWRHVPNQQWAIWS